jgi:uncharacterized protein YfaT (DUF1175 family)
MRGAASLSGVACLSLLELLAGCSGTPGELRPASAVPALTADGFSTARLRFRSSRPLRHQRPVVEVVEGRRSLAVRSVAASADTIETVVSAGVLPGRAVLEVRAGSLEPAWLTLELTPDTTDADADGLPDCLRLGDEADRFAFTEWFTFLAEAQYCKPPDQLPAEIVDCAALIRFAFREALREHNGAWAAGLGLTAVPGVSGVKKYQYPFTLLGAALFRVKPGPMEPPDLSSGAFAEFADAETLMRRNASFVSRDIGRAAAGDLLFFRQLGQHLPFHAMIHIGRSHFEIDAAPQVVYHTGPAGGSRGEIRRLSVQDLLRHPSPQWRPYTGNSNFLGVYRWNILRDPS